MKKIMLLISFVSAMGVAQAQTQIPENYQIKCWDGSFAYNRLEAQTKDDKIAFTFSGQQLNVFRNILPPGDERHWGQLEATIEFDREECKVLESNKKIIACKGENGTLAVRVRMARDVDEFTVAIKTPFLQMRLVEEISFWGMVTKGHQVALYDMYAKDSLLIAQNFYSGLTGDDERSCGLQD